MKKVLIIAGIGIVASLQFLGAQRSMTNELADRLFKEGKDMFLDNNFVGAQNTLTQFRKLSENNDLKVEAEYLIVASSYFRGSENAADLLREYLDNYPATYHRNDIYFYLGSFNFNKKDWKKALYWFNQADVDYFNLKDQEDYTFRSAFANLQVGNRKEAYQQFDILARNSNKYFEPASYYKAYIDFYDGKYDSAIAIFQKLKAKPEYNEQCLFFITQSLFLKNDLNQTINAGEDYLTNYPNSQNSTEVHRLLGNSYYRQGNTQTSINYYSKYLAKTDKPFPEDMFQLGTAYMQTGEYQKAINALQYSASTNDKLGQASYVLLGQCLLKENDTPAALMAFDAASRVKFDSSLSEVALYNYAMLVHKTSLSVFDQSITTLQRFLKEYPSSRYTNEINNQLASTLLSTKNYGAALNVIDQMRSPSAQILRAKQTILFQLGSQNFIDGNYAQAKQRLDACINMGNYDNESKNEAYYWRGETNYRAENYLAAAKDYQTYIAQTSAQSDNKVTASYNLGYANFKLKQYNEAQSSFKRYIAQERNTQKLTYSDALNRIGDCYFYNKNYPEALSSYNQAANSNSQSADYAEFQKASVLGLQQNYAGKITSLNAMMNRFPNSQYYDDALYEKSRALVMQNKETEAAPILSQLLKNHPNSNISAKAGVLLGQIYYNTNNSNKAIEAYKQVVEKHKNSEEAQTSIQSLEGIYRDLNDISGYANYVNSLGSGVVISPSRQDSLTYLAAENVFMKGRPAEAVTSMRKYLQQYPNGQFTGDAHYYLGAAAYDSNDRTTALSEFQYAIKAGSSKNLNKALALSADIQLQQGNTQAAYNSYKQMERSAVSGDDRSLALLGILKTGAIIGNKENETIATANQLIANPKTSPEVLSDAYLYRAKAYLKMADTPKAIEDLKKIANDTRNASGAEAQYLLTDTYYRAKDYAKAEQQALSFIKTGTPHGYWMARTFILLSDNYKAKGDKFMAKQYIESLKANYKGTEADIATMISQRLLELNK